MSRDDYTLTIEDASKQLNKSVRTIHRYKDSGRLSFVIGQTQGNPLFFSRSEVLALAQELYPNLALPSAAVQESEFWDRLERVERSISLIERNPLLERLFVLALGALGAPPDGELADTLQQLADLEQRKQPVDPTLLGNLLVRLGTALKAQGEARGGG